MASEQEQRREEFLRQAFQQIETAIHSGYELEILGFSMTARNTKAPFPLQVEFELDWREVDTDAQG